MRAAPSCDGSKRRPRRTARHPPPAVIDAADPGAAFEHGAEARGVAALHIGAQPVERGGEPRLRGAPARAGRASVSRSWPRIGSPKADEGLRAALQPEAVFDGERKHGAVGREFDEPRDAGLEPERTLAHIAEASLRGDPERAVRRRTGSRRLVRRKSRRAARAVEIDPEGADAAEDAVLLQHRGIDGRVALISGEEAVGGQDVDGRIPPGRMIGIDDDRARVAERSACPMTAIRSAFMWRVK